MQGMAEDYVDYLLDGTPQVETTDWADVAALLEQSQQQREERLEQELAQIKRQLAERDQIHHELVEELERKIERYTDRLDHLYTIGKGRLDGTRDDLKDRIVAFYEQLRDEHREHWRDRQALERERRDVRRTMAELDDDVWSELL